MNLVGTYNLEYVSKCSRRQLWESKTKESTPSYTLCLDVMCCVV